ncbi:MAG: M81 family metallopeptidase, partial [Chloroflexi bacterium]
MELRRGPRTRPRVAIGGIHIESSTFSPHRSGHADFTVARGDELLARYDLPRDVEWVPLLHARALPGGAVEREFYDFVKTELIERLRAVLPVHGVLLDIHGAMSVVGLTDAEGDFASAVRDRIGTDALISASMDPHGNVSRRLIGALDLATSHRMSPHEDAALTRTRAVANLVRCLRDGVHPAKAWVRVPVLLPGERASTRDEPARGIYGRLPAIAAQPGIID